jgi:hypothetical protein
VRARVGRNFILITIKLDGRDKICQRGSWNGASNPLKLRDRRIRRTNCQRKSYGSLASNPSNPASY